MKFYWFKNIYGWQMTGFVNKNNTWFFGFSRVKEKTNDN